MTLESVMPICRICGLDVTAPAPGTSFPSFIQLVDGYYHAVCVREEDAAFLRLYDLPVPERGTS
jgi:hypothetical protein